MGRAGDFSGPGTAEQSLLGTSRVAALRDGGTVWLVGDADAPHAFSYVRNVVAGLAALGQAEEDVEGRVFHLPVVQAPPRAVVEAIADALGASGRARVIPGWAVRGLGAFGGFLGELVEALYQWDRPFLVDDGAFRMRFPGHGTDLPEAARQIAAALAEEQRVSA